MRLLRSHRGQSTAEYAVLFAIVIGAAVAMQQYVKSRLQGAIASHANAYLTAQTDETGAAPTPFEPNRTVDTTSGASSSLAMSSATTGTSTVDSSSDTESTITKDNN